MEGLIFQLILLVIFGALAAAIAAGKGRSAVGWFFGGFFLGLIGVIVVAVLPNVKAQQEKEQHAEAERRRLREQLRQERMKNEAMRQNVSTRLDHHDRALGMDTRAESPLLKAGKDSDNIFDQLPDSKQPERPATANAPKW
mgnify:CR=1 FL=1